MCYLCTCGCPTGHTKCPRGQVTVVFPPLGYTVTLAAILDMNNAVGAQYKLGTRMEFSLL